MTSNEAQQIATGYDSILKGLPSNSSQSSGGNSPVNSPVGDSYDKIIQNYTTSQNNFVPYDLKRAQDLQSKDSGSYNGLCQKFVDDVFDVPYPRTGKESAINAWQNAPNKVQNLQGIKSGDLIYFTPNQSNATWDFPNGAGHVGIYKGNGIFKSATDSGIEDHTLQEWNSITGQQPLGYIPTHI